MSTSHANLIQKPPFFMQVADGSEDDKVRNAESYVLHPDFRKGLLSRESEFPMIGAVHELVQQGFHVPLGVRIYVGLRWLFLKSQVNRPGYNDYNIARWFMSGNDHWLRELHRTAGPTPVLGATIGQGGYHPGQVAPVRQDDMRRMTAQWAIGTLCCSCPHFMAAWERLFPAWGRA